MATVASVGRRLSAYAALVRVPNVFTAPPDVVLGAALAAAAGLPVDPLAVAVLAVASALLYAGGTALNDAVDAPLDAAEGRDRPIPTGRVSRTAGYGLAAACLLVGVLLARAIGTTAGGVAALVAAAVVAYDGFLNDRPLGLLGMGATRGLNVVLGAAAAGSLALPAWGGAVPVVIAGYVAAVTYLGTAETTGGNRRPVAVTGVAVALASLAAVGLPFLVRPTFVHGAAAIALAGAFVTWTGRSLTAAYVTPYPWKIGAAVGDCVLGLAVLDAAFAAVAGPAWSLSALAFLAPDAGLARWVDVA